jgi:hypothetical protein
VIREAKGVALHDLSFWSSTLPLLDGLPRIIREYEHQYSRGVYLRLDAVSGRQLHDETLRSFASAASGEGLPTWPRATVAERLGSSLFALMTDKPTTVPPQINQPIAGCGVVIGGSCDLLWPPYVVELKLTGKAPGVRDVRQVLVYAGLLHLDRGLSAVHGVVANPRLGTALEFEIDELLLMTGGLALNDFAAELAQFLVTAAQSN